jgi:hypothetical protein
MVHAISGSIFLSYAIALAVLTQVYGISTTISNELQILLFVTLGIYLLVTGLVQNRRELQLENQLSRSVTDRDEALQDLNEVKREIDDLGSAFRELKECENSLKSALIESNSRLEVLKVERQRFKNSSAQALVLLSLLQEKGRFLDFIMRDISSVEDEQLGRVARFVHQGCSGVIKEHMDLAPIYSGLEGDTITPLNNLHANSYRLSGVDSNSPGKVVHKGWRAMKVTLPDLIIKEAGNESTVGGDFGLILAPAEVAATTVT